MNEQIKQRITQLNNGEVPNGYEKTEIGTFPIGWKTTTLDKLLDFKNGVNADKEKYNSGVKMISVMDILTDSPIYYDKIKGQVDIDEKTLDTYSVTYGDILFQRSSETFEDAGKSNVYLDKDRTATYSGFVIRGKKKADYNPYFLNEALRIGQVRNQIIRNAAGSQHINVGQDSLAKIIVPLASDAEQSRIAEILMKWDEAIELQSEHLQLIQFKKKHLIKQLMIPRKHWVTRTMREVGDLYQPVTISESELTENGYTVYGANGEIGYYRTYNHENSEIAITCRGSTCGQVTFTKPKSWITGNAMVFKIDENKYDKIFLYYYCCSLGFKKAISGSGQPQITRQALQNMLLHIPSDIDEQCKIAKVLVSIDRNVNLNTEKLNVMIKQRKTLQQYLLNGIVRV